MGVGLAILKTQAQTEETPLSSPATVSIRTEASYIQLSRQEMMEYADAILVGQVAKISTTQFNQDGGEAWEPLNANDVLLALHYVDIVVQDALISTAESDEKIRIAVLGTSPLDANDLADHHLKEGDQVIVFLQSAELAWRDGPRPVWRFVALPAESALVLQSDGLYHDGWLDKSPIALDALILQVEQSRSSVN